MPVIWKYPAVFGDVFEHDMPKHARVLTVQLQDGQPFLWALIKPDAEVERRQFLIVGTGHEFDSSWQYVGTYQQPPFVWHLLAGVTLADAMRGSLGGL